MDQLNSPPSDEDVVVASELQDYLSDDENRSTDESSCSVAISSSKLVTPILKRSSSNSTGSQKSLSSNSQKRRVVFDSVEIFYFERTQGFTCVPNHGGSTLGMKCSHWACENLPVRVFHRKRRRERHRVLHRHCVDGKIRLSPDQAAALNRKISESPELCPSPDSFDSDSFDEFDPSSSPGPKENGEVLSFSESSSSFSSEEAERSLVFPGDSSTDESDDDSEALKSVEDYYLLQPIPLKRRRVLLRKSGVNRIDQTEKNECDQIRDSRAVCGCTCADGICYPETCLCALNGISCQVDRLSFPCACVGPEYCRNPLGRVKFDPVRARTHYLHTQMRLELEKTTKCTATFSETSNPPDQHRPTSSVCLSDQSADEEASSSSSLSGPSSEEQQRDENENFLAAYNTTSSGSCRDCQNARYVHVLMQEWSSQQQQQPQQHHHHQLQHSVHLGLPQPLERTYWVPPESQFFVNQHEPRMAGQTDPVSAAQPTVQFPAFEGDFESAAVTALTGSASFHNVPVKLHHQSYDHASPARPREVAVVDDSLAEEGEDGEEQEAEEEEEEEDVASKAVPKALPFCSRPCRLEPISCLLSSTSPSSKLSHDNQGQAVLEPEDAAPAVAGGGVVPTSTSPSVTA